MFVIPRSRCAGLLLLFLTQVPVRYAQEKSGAGAYLPVEYSPDLQPLVNVSVGGQWLRLVFDASSAYTVAFVKEYKACLPENLSSCYSYKAAEKQGSLHVCADNNVPQAVCGTRPDRRYSCSKYGYLESLQNATAHEDALIIDGLEYFQKSVEAVDTMMMQLDGSTPEILSWSYVPLRLLTAPMTIPKTQQELNISLHLFEGADGILGASGPSLSCRNTTLWQLLLQRLDVHRFALDFRAPEVAVIRDPGPSRIVFNEVDPDLHPKLLWSQPKQTGDMINDGMHELLIFRPQVCGVDLLYNSSSNWLTVIDTSGPCLALPPFLFDRMMTHVPMDCPFQLGEKSSGRLCSPRRGPSNNMTLPALSFQLADAQEPSPPSVSLPLERLVFRNDSGDELLCMARQDTNPEGIPADMMYSHIALGSMVMSVLYTVVDLQNHSIGLALRGPAGEASEAGCSPPPVCIGLQRYFPPLNLCENPQCSDYILMTLDETTKTCRWKKLVPTGFVLLLVTLVSLDMLSHKLYKQAIQRAREFSQ